MPSDGKNVDEIAALLGNNERSMAEMQTMMNSPGPSIRSKMSIGRLQPPMDANNSMMMKVEEQSTRVAH